MIDLRAVGVLVVCLPALAGQGQPPSSQAPSAKTWIGRHQEIEEYLQNAECLSVNAFGRSDPNTLKRCTLPPGGPIARMAWKSTPDGTDRGFRESYKTEIAAYELDKLLKMDMVPPTVERPLQGIKGRAQQWVEGVLDMQGDASPDEAHRSEWDNQLARMVMFDDLIGNKDRNRGTMLRDAAWNLILIDHSRAFGVDTKLPYKLTRIDRALWAKMEGLTRRQLDAALGPWLNESEIGAILERRKRMKGEIQSLPR